MKKASQKSPNVFISFQECKQAKARKERNKALTMQMFPQQGFGSNMYNMQGSGFIWKQGNTFHNDKDFSPHDKVPRLLRLIILITSWKYRHVQEHDIILTERLLFLRKTKSWHFVVWKYKNLSRLLKINAGMTGASHCLNRYPGYPYRDIECFSDFF